jgi:hypothetical protein
MRTALVPQCIQADYREDVIVEVSPDAASLIGQRGGRIWVWAAHPRVCCAGSPAWMRAATDPPADGAGFSPVTAAGVEVFFRGLTGRRPDILQIALHGKRRRTVEAYWDGCLWALP